MPTESKWRSREALLLLMAASFPIAFSTWQALLNNFAVEQIQFNGELIGGLQSVREIPGFLAFTAVFLLLWFREQRLGLFALGLLGFGVAITGVFASVHGLFLTTILMSVGFHFYETVHQSLTLQWLPKARAPHLIGRQMAAKSLASIVAFVLVWLLLDQAQCSMALVFGVGGGLTLVLAIVAWCWFPRFEATHVQRKQLVFRKRYWLFYALTFMAGARRQIFVVFAGFLLVERFGFVAQDIALLLLVNHVFNLWLAPRVGRLIARFGERRALILEYAGLIGVFVAYAFVDSAWLAVSLFLVDHLFYALAIAQKTYFQKIADPGDLASTAGVAFTINHIAAVALPVIYGQIWIVSPSAVFLSGAALAGVSLLLSCNVPRDPKPGHEVVVGHRGVAPSAGAA